MKYQIIALFYSLISYSQTNDSINYKKLNLYNLNIKFDSIIKSKTSFNYKIKVNDFSSFSVYNQNTKLNDYFNLSKDPIYFVKSININANQLVPKDSFNPNGVNNLGVGLIMGSINTVSKGILFKL
jgi:hypothetical protein